MTDDALEEALTGSRPALLRHCYRMLGSFAEAEELTQDVLERAWKRRGEYRGDAPVERWLFSIATNACLNALKDRRRRALPQLEGPAAGPSYVLGESEAEAWLTPAPDAALFPDASAALEARQTVTLAFVALLQRLPPRQRAALVLKDVLGWTAEDVAQTLETTVASVNSALTRARAELATPLPPSAEPPPATLAAFVHAWEGRDLERLVALLRRDVTLAMPPHQVWFAGVESVEAFLRTSRFQAFWASLDRLVPTRANGLPAFAFLLRDGEPRAPHHSIMVTRFVDGLVAEMTTFVGRSNFVGFAMPTEGTAQFGAGALS